MSCNEFSHFDAGGVARHPLTRAGVRRPPRGSDQPTGAFVVIEMAVLFCVSALAMVSIIVSIDDGSVPHVTRMDDQSTRVVVSSSAAAGAQQDAAEKTGHPSTTVQVVR